MEQVQGKSTSNKLLTCCTLYVDVSSFATHIIKYLNQCFLNGGAHPPVRGGVARGAPESIQPKPTPTPCASP